MEKRHNATLDGLRGVAALVVATGHMGMATHGLLSEAFRGNLAVNFFFMLSGFVLATAYEKRLHSDISPWYFIKLRIIRLFPLIVLGVALGAAIGGLKHIGVLSIVLSMLLIPVNHRTFFPLDNPLWSLFYELWVNVVYAFIVKYKRLAIAVALAGAGLLLAITLRGHYISGGMTLSTLPVGLGEVFWGFFVGVLMARVLTPVRVARLPSVSFSVLGLIFLAALWDWKSSPQLDTIFVFLALPAILLLGVKDVVSGWMRKVAIVMGKLSYPLYVLHMPFIMLLMRFGEPVSAKGWLIFPIIIGVSYAAMKWYDEPVRDWLRSRMLRPVVVAQVFQEGG